MRCPMSAPVTLPTSRPRLWPVAFVLAKWRTSRRPFPPPPRSSFLASLSPVSGLNSVVLILDHACQDFGLSGFLILPGALPKPHPWNSPTIRVLSSVRCQRNGSGTGTTAGSWGLLSAAHSAKPSKSRAARHPQSAAFPFLAVAVSNVHWAVVFLMMMPTAPTWW